MRAFLSKLNFWLRLPVQSCFEIGRAGGRRRERDCYRLHLDSRRHCTGRAGGRRDVPSSFRVRPHRNGRGPRREQSAWEVFLGFLIFFTVACDERRRERERDRGSGKAPPESHLRHTQRPDPTELNRRTIFSWETFVELQIEVAGREGPGSGRPARPRPSAANGRLKYGFMSRFLPLPAEGRLTTWALSFVARARA